MKHGMSRSIVIWANDMQCVSLWLHMTADVLAVTFVGKPEYVATYNLYLAA